MKKNKFRALLLLLIAILLISCNSYSEPFSNLIEKKKAINLIRSNLDLTKAEYSIIKHKDSILHQLSVSLQNKKIKQKLIERRLDSFFLGDYSQSELIFILKIDKISGWEVEIDRNENKNPKGYLQLKSIEEAENFSRKFDSKYGGKNLIANSNQSDSIKLSNKKLELVLTKSRYQYVKNDLDIKKEIINAIQDSLSQKLIRRRVDSFILKNYTKHMLISSLELDRIFKGSTIEIDRNVNPDKALNINSFKDLKKFKENYDKAKKKFGVRIVKDTTKSDSIIKPKKKG